MFSRISPYLKTASNRMIGIRKMHSDKIPKYGDVRNIYSYVMTNFGTALVIGAMIVQTIAFYPNKTLIQKEKDKKLSDAIVNSTINDSKSKNYVTRQKLEDDVKKIFVSELIGIYYIIYGPRGVGKSEVVDHVAIGEPAFIKISVTSADSKNDLIQQITTELLNYPAGLNIDSFLIAIKKCSIIPTIIFDVEDSSVKDHDRVIDAVRSLSKTLARYCRVIIILAEPNMVTKFGMDINREKFTYMDEMTHDEANELLVALKFQGSKKDISDIFDNIGTTPAMLINLARNECTVKEFIDYQLLMANRDLLTFPHKLILKKLKMSPDGVKVKTFKDVIDKSVHLDDPKAAMNSSNAIVYRQEDHSYRIMSRAHRTALKNYSV